MLHHDFRRFLDNLDKLNPAQIEDAQTKIRDLRRKTEAISEFEARTIQKYKCPSCGDNRRQKWGRTRTNIQRYRCNGCMKTYSGRTASAIGRIHRPDLFMVVLRDMLGTSVPLAVRNLARRLGLNKYTVWRWRMLVFLIIGTGGATSFQVSSRRMKPTSGSRARDRGNGCDTSLIRKRSRRRLAPVGKTSRHRG